MENFEHDENMIYVECKIQDNGSGIDEQTMKNLFNPFTQSTNQNRPLATKGHGLGLYICKNLMKLMNGYITVESDIGAGTIFRVAFPYHPDTRRASQKSIKIDLVSTERGYGIMVVEDNRINREIVKRMLTQERYQVFAYENGQDAIAGFVQHYNEIDLVLMDLHLPDMKGSDSAKIFRNFEGELTQGNNKIVPIIAFTASTVASELSEAIDSGMSGVIIKPFIRKDFLARLLQIIDT
ncbi:MAG: response regulator [Sphingobacteriaceae bacterium]|nr:MAG: response regulator [Sphingobacteriaceae bacterium]